MSVRLQSIAGVVAACVALVAVSCFGQSHGLEATPEAAEEILREPADAIASDELTALSPQIVPFLQEPGSSEEPVFSEAPSDTSTTIAEMPPRWRARVGALFLNRSRERGNDLAGMLPYAHYFSESSFPERSIGDADFVFPVGAAVDTSLRYVGPWADIDFRYFGVVQSIAEVGPHSALFAGVLGTPSSVGRFQSELTSSLQSAELNLRREVGPNVALLGGFRYIQFRDVLLSDERLDYGGPNGWIDTNSYDWRAQNELFGLQLGAETLLWSYEDRLRIEAAAKAGIFGNAASSSLGSEIQFQDATTSNHWAAYRGNAAFVGDVNFSASYRFSRHVALRGGYQLLWLSGVATVTEQSQNLAANPFRTYAECDVFFHGAMVGVESAW